MSRNNANWEDKNPCRLKNIGLTVEIFIKIHYLPPTPEFFVETSLSLPEENVNN
jgi:hypothetical protein